MYFSNEQSARIDAIVTDLHLCKSLLEACNLQKKLQHEITACMNENIQFQEDEPQRDHKDSSAWDAYVSEVM